MNNINFQGLQIVYTIEGGILTECYCMNAPYIFAEVSVEFKADFCQYLINKGGLL